MPSAAAVRTRDVESEATRRAILDAAEHLIATVGEDGLSIREVCARAGVTAPTIYHHFGDKRGLVERVVDARFAEFDRSFTGRAPTDPVEAVRWGFDRYVEYGRRHPAHYRLLFGRPVAHATPGGNASYDHLRRSVAAVAAAGRLRAPVEDAAAALWAAMHGATSLVTNNYFQPEHPAIALLRDATIAQLTQPPPRRKSRPRRRTERNER
jgi:AcrR family transcriptional regulator